MHSSTLNFIGPYAKKLEYLLFSENILIGQLSSFKCPSWSIRPVIDFGRNIMVTGVENMYVDINFGLQLDEDIQ